MAELVKKIRTDKGDLQIDYNALANLPDLTKINYNTLVNLPDLTKYITHDETLDELKKYTSTSQLNSTLGSYVSKQSLATSLSDYVSSNALATALSQIDYGTLVNLPTIINPNLLINGDFQVWQRGAQFSNISNAYTADRWRIQNGNNVTTLVEKSTEVPSNQPACQSIHIKESYSSNSYLRYYFDSALKGTFTLSFWYKTTKAFDVSVYNNGSPTILPGRPATIGTWTRSVHTFTAESLTYINIVHAMSAGDVYITGVKLEYGETATPFTPKTYQEELEACQNYFQKINLLYKPGVTNNSGAFVSFSCDTKLRSADSIAPKVSIDVVPSQLRTTAADTINTTLTFKSASCYKGYLVVDFNSSENIGAKVVAWPISDFKISVDAELQ